MVNNLLSIEIHMYLQYCQLAEDFFFLKNPKPAERYTLFIPNAPFPPKKMPLRRSPNWLVCRSMICFFCFSTIFTRSIFDFSINFIVIVLPLCFPELSSSSSNSDSELALSHGLYGGSLEPSSLASPAAVAGAAVAGGFFGGFNHLEIVVFVLLFVVVMNYYGC